MHEEETIKQLQDLNEQFRLEKELLQGCMRELISIIEEPLREYCGNGSFAPNTQGTLRKN